MRLQSLITTNDRKESYYYSLWMWLDHPMQISAHKASKITRKRA